MTTPDPQSAQLSHAAADEGDVDNILERKLSLAWARGGRILALGCGSFAEGLGLAGRDLSNVTVIDSDDAELARIEARYDRQIVALHGETVTFLEQFMSTGERFDLVYSRRGLAVATERNLLHTCFLIESVLRPGGEAIIVLDLPSRTEAATSGGGNGRLGPDPFAAWTLARIADNRSGETVVARFALRGF